MDDNFDFDGKQELASQRAPLGIWDRLSILVLVITVCASLYFLLILVNPNLAFNLFPPVLSNPARLAVTQGDTPRPTFTPLSTNTPSSDGLPTMTSGPASIPESEFSASSVTAVMSSFIPRLQDRGCNWLGVGGTVEDVNNSPIVGIVVRLTGILSGNPIELTTVSGVSPDYGKAGYEFVLGAVPLTSNKEIYIQLLDEAGLPMSEKVFLVTSTDCEKNLILVRFKKNR